MPSTVKRNMTAPITAMLMHKAMKPLSPGNVSTRISRKVVTTTSSQREEDGKDREEAEYS